MSEAKVSAFRRAARRVSWALGVPDLLYRLQERRMAAAAPPDPDLGEGPPLPPALMRVMVVGTASASEFLDAGKAVAEEFEAVFAAHGRSVTMASAVLDVGCGCGRLARWMTAMGAGDRVSGVDINAPLVRWCRAHLPGRWEAIRLGQALPFAPGAFELAYACSVATHLREATTRAWYADLARVMAPGGLLLTTFHDQHHPTAASSVAGGPSVAERLPTEGHVVEIDRMEGSNRLAAYATIERLVELAGDGFELVEYQHSRRTVCRQAIALFRRR